MHAAVAEVGEHRRPGRRGHAAAVHEHERIAGAALEHADRERGVGEPHVPALRPDAVLGEQRALGVLERPARECCVRHTHPF